MAKPVFQHYGVPTDKSMPGEVYAEDMKLHYTDPEKNPYRIEFIRFDSDCPMPQDLQTKTHVAYMVDDIQAAIVGKEVVLEPTDLSDELRIAFINDGDALIELMQKIG